MRAILVVLLCCVSSVFSQAKVGTTGGEFLQLCPSIRAIGMGEAGVALIDRYSYYFNPASLGLSEDPRLSLAASPLITSYEFGEPGNRPEFRSSSIFVYPFGYARDAVSEWSLALAGQWTRLSSPDIVERTYEQGTDEGTGRTFKAADDAYSVSAGIGRHSNLDLSGGLTIKFVEEKFRDYEGTGSTADAGLMVRAPLFGDWEVTPDEPCQRPRGRLVVGAAVSNFAGDMKFIDKSYPWPETWRFGISADLRFASFSVIPALEMIRFSDRAPDKVKAGIEFDFRHAIQTRLGRYMIAESQGDATTYGLGVSARGLLALLQRRGEAEESQHGPDVQFSFAGITAPRYSPMDGTTYFGVELKL